MYALDALSCKASCSLLKHHSTDVVDLCVKTELKFALYTNTEYFHKQVLLAM